MNRVVLELLRCPKCQSSLGRSADRVPALACVSCEHRVAIVDDIPRFVDRPVDEIARRTQTSFGYEWTHFNDWSHSGEINFQEYFDGVDLDALSGSLVLDAGCGMGRHARQVAPFAGHLLAVDFSAAVDQAARNTADAGNVSCIQADLLSLPVADNSFDFIYSLGVLHHLTDTERAIAKLVTKLRPGGRLRIYMYWKKHGWSGRLLRIVTFGRRFTTHLPLPVLRLLTFLLSSVLYVAVIVPYKVLQRAGVRTIETWPLVVYTKYPFNVLYNDQFDRFSAPIEKRYDADEVQRLLEQAGLCHVRVRPAFGWVAEGVKS